MSSFRIEGRYITLAAPCAQEPCPDTGAEETEDGLLEAERRRAEIEEAVRRTAELDADRLRERAGIEAGAILEKARQEAAQTAEQAAAAAEEVKETARLEGLRLGREQAAAEAEARRKEEAGQLESLLGRLNADYGLLVDALEGDAICLILDIVKKVIGIKMDESDEVFLGLVSTALEQLKQTGEALIRVGPEDYRRYFGDHMAPGATHFGKTGAVVTEEEDLRPGGLVVESEGEVLDFSVDKQLRRLQDAFLQTESAAVG